MVWVLGPYNQAARKGEGAGPKKKQKVELAKLNFICMVSHGPDDDPGGWWGAVGHGSGGGCTHSDAGGGLVLLVLTWYLFFPSPFPHSLFLSSLFLTSPSHPLRPVVGLGSCPVCPHVVVVE